MKCRGTSLITALLLVVPEILKYPEDPEGFFRAFRESFFCKSISRISHYGFFGEAAWGTVKNRFKARRPARPPDAPWRPRRDGASDGASHAAARPCPPAGRAARKTRLLEPLPEIPAWISGRSRARKWPEIPGDGSKKTPFFGYLGKSGCLKGAKEGP